MKFAQIPRKNFKAQGFFVKTQADGKYSNLGRRKGVQKKPGLVFKLFASGEKSAMEEEA